MRFHLPTKIKLLLSSCALLFAGTVAANAQDLCNDNDFAFYGMGNIYGSASYNAVYKLQFAGSTVTIDTADKIPAPAAVSLQGLAIADLGSGTAIYSITNKFTTGTVCKREVYTYSGGSWSIAHVDSSTAFPTGNAAGNGNYLYYHNIRTSSGSINWPAAIQRFTGTGFTTILLDSSYTTTYPVADIAVDNSGNVYYFTGDDTTNKTKVTHLNIISPTGVLLHKMPVVINGPTLYGCFFKEDVLWVCCLGNNTIANPHMTPVTIQGNTATAGTPVAIPKPILGFSTGPNSTTTIYLTFNDHASCTSTDILEPNAVPTLHTAGAHIFPNPATNAFTVQMPSAANRQLTMYNSVGQLCYSAKVTSEQYTVDCSRFSKGLYLVKISSDEGEEVRRVVVE